MTHHGITFRALEQKDFGLLLQWHNAPHVHAWWDTHKAWTWGAVERKYSSRLVTQPDASCGVFSYIYDYAHTPAGYCQFYDTTLFLDPLDLRALPPHTAGIDFFLGNASLLGQGIAACALSLFSETLIHEHFTHAFVDPALDNQRAIAFFKKVGFNTLEGANNRQWMIKRIDRAPSHSPHRDRCFDQE